MRRPRLRQTFGTSALTTAAIDPNLLNGWGVRPSDWQFGASVQQQVLPRVSVEVGYFKRWLQNFTATDNLAVRPATSRRSASPRRPIRGCPAAAATRSARSTTSSLGQFGQTSNNITLASNFGTQYQSYNGMLVNVSARIAQRPDAPGRHQQRKRQRLLRQLRRFRNCACRSTEPDQSVLPRRSGIRHEGHARGRRPTPCRRSTCCLRARSGATRAPPLAGQLERAGRDRLGGARPSGRHRGHDAVRSTWSLPARCGAIASTRSTFASRRCSGSAACVGAPSTPPSQEAVSMSVPISTPVPTPIRSRM